MSMPRSSRIACTHFGVRPMPLQVRSGFCGSRYFAGRLRVRRSQRRPRARGRGRPSCSRPPPRGVRARRANPCVPASRAMPTRSGPWRAARGAGRCRDVRGRWMPLGSPDCRWRDRLPAGQGCLGMRSVSSFRTFARGRRRRFRPCGRILVDAGDVNPSRTFDDYKRLQVGFQVDASIRSVGRSTAHDPVAS